MDEKLQTDEIRRKTCTKRLLDEGVIVVERLDVENAKLCDCLLIQYCLDDDCDVNELIHLSIELPFAINDIAQKDVVQFVGVIIKFKACVINDTIDDFVTTVKETRLPGIPTIFLFFVGSPKYISFRCNGNGRRWWHCVRAKSMMSKRVSSFVKIIETKFQTCPSRSTCGIVKILTSVALTYFFSSDKYQCILYTAVQDQGDFLPLYFACAQNVTVRILLEKPKYDVDGNRMDVSCLLIVAETNVNFKRLRSVVFESSVMPDFKSAIKRVSLSSLTTVSLRTLLLAAIRDRIICWKKFVYILPKESHIGDSSSDVFQQSALEGFRLDPNWRDTLTNV